MLNETRDVFIFRNEFLNRDNISGSSEMIVYINLCNKIESKRFDNSSRIKINRSVLEI